MATSDESVGQAGLTSSDAAWHEGATGWEPISRAFIRRELTKPDPDYRSLANRLAGYSAAERHAAWIDVAQEAPSRMGRTRAYLEALHNDPDSTSVAWGWLDGDFDLTGRVEHIVRRRDPRTLATVETLRERLGSILDVGGTDLGGDSANTDVAPAGPGTEQAQPVVAKPAPARQQPVVAKPAQTRQQPVVAKPAAAQVESVVAPMPIGQQVAPSPAAPTWSPTHFVPAGGLPAWDYPDPSRQPMVVLDAGLGLVLESIAGDWALVRAVNGWRGWVDGRRLAGWP